LSGAFHVTHHRVMSLRAIQNVSGAVVVGKIVLVARLAAAAPPDEPAPNTNLEIAPVDTEPARLDSPLPTDPVELTELPEIAYPSAPEPTQPAITDPAMYRRGRNLILISIAGAVPMVVGMFFMIGEQLICSLNDISWDGYSDDDADKLIHCTPTPPGPILIGVGGAAFITLMATGGALRAKAKSPKRVQAILPIPVVSPQGAGVTWALRF
jgi:hypothetical protein